MKMHTQACCGQKPPDEMTTWRLSFAFGVSGKISLAWKVPNDWGHWIWNFSHHGLSCPTERDGKSISSHI
jgi:hypothetical protein